MHFTENNVLRSLCRSSFYDFVKEFWETVVPEKLILNWHIKYIANEMQELAERVFRGEPKAYDLVINISPGTSKSTTCSILFPIWTWTRMPTARHICASYSFPLACDLGRKSRDVVTSNKFQDIFPEIELRDDQNTKHYFQNTKGGTRYSVGVNGSVLGMHGHFLNVDDPLDPQQASSELDLKASNTWLKETLASRKVDKAVAVTTLIMQRLHQDDPTAQMLKRGDVRHICIPAEEAANINPPELRRFYKDGLMDPVRLGHKVLAQYKRFGEYIYSSQFRQSPVPPGGGMFKVNRIKWGVPPSKFKRLIRYWDKAGTLADGAYSVGLKMGEDFDGRIWILDVKRFQLDSFEREMMIKRTAQEDGKHVTVGLEQEGASGGKESAQNTVRNLKGYRVIVCKVTRGDGDKVYRADPFSVQVNNGGVYLPVNLRMNDEWIGWAEEYLDELMFFPFSKYKDQVDASSGAFNIIYKPRKRAGGMW